MLKSFQIESKLPGNRAATAAGALKLMQEEASKKGEVDEEME